MVKVAHGLAKFPTMTKDPASVPSGLATPGHTATENVKMASE